MLKNQHINLKIVEKVALALGELNNEMLYIGGAVVCLYVTDEGAELPRPTKDIDISVKIKTYAQMDRLREKLATKNIYPAPTENVIYRYCYEDILIDFIPYDETPLGPTNSWLKPGFEKACPVKIGEAEIKILPVSLFLAAKWETFKSRGNDPRFSHDFEDIIYIIDNNLNLVDDIKDADKKVQCFLKEMSNEILSHPSCSEIIECHLNPFTLEERKNLIIHKLKKILELE
jgi:hypothetical protein